MSKIILTLILCGISTVANANFSISHNDAYIKLMSKIDSRIKTKQTNQGILKAYDFDADSVTYDDYSDAYSFLSKNTGYQEQNLHRYITQRPQLNLVKQMIFDALLNNFQQHRDKLICEIKQHNLAQQVIKSYISTNSAATPLYNNAGNVLAYKNYLDEIIVLKNGSYRDDNQYLETLGLVNVIPIEDIASLTLTTPDNNIINKYTRYNFKTRYEKDSLNANMVLNYMLKAINGASEVWKNKYLPSNFKLTMYESDIIAEYHNHINKRPQKEEDQKEYAIFKKLTHTEFQIAALLYEYRNTKNEKQKEALKRLLPKCLVDETSKESIYSLFEACQSCRNIEWIKNHKDKFLAHVVDKQQGEKVIVLDEFTSQNDIENDKYKK